MIDTVDFALRLLSDTGRILTSGFTGLGVIFYRPPMRLPVMPLGDSRQLPYNLPIQGGDRIAETLALTADDDSAFHDGFHLVDIKLKQLTHIAQFVAPTLPSRSEQMARCWPSGARQMTALLVSRLDSVAFVGLLSTQEVLVFSNGELVRSIRMIQT